MDNLEKSQIAIAAILANLYRRGIQTGSFHGDDVELPAEFSPFVTQSFRWLISEGLVRADRLIIGNDHKISASSATLTSKGFDILGIEVVGKQKTLGNMLTELMKDGAARVSNTAISEIVGQVISFTAKSMIGPQP